ncbi:MAG: ORF6N domain-containing protein [Rhodocyclaceae bacterium]|jgi:hypothetical protein|nr:ORF6N domain-containing protein [Rhodocyclaceae bacterium]
MSQAGLVNLAGIASSILTLRGQRVMLSSDLAKLYEVTPGALMQAVKRNVERFPADFMFQLPLDEWKNLKSQNVISSWGGARTPPYAFIEQGVGMLSSALRSERAVRVYIEIMRTFVRLRRMLAEHRELAQRLDELEQRYDKQFSAVFEAIRQLMTPPKEAKRPIGFIADIEGKQSK